MLTDLTKISTSEGFLDDDVDQCMNQIVVFHFYLVDILPRDEVLGVCFDQELVLSLLVMGLENDRVFKVDCGVEVHATEDIHSQKHLKIPLAVSHKSVHDVGVTVYRWGDCHIVEVHIELTTEGHLVLVGENLDSSRVSYQLVGNRFLVEVRTSMTTSASSVSSSATSVASLVSMVVVAIAISIILMVVICIWSIVVV